MKRTILLVLVAVFFAWAGIGCKKNTSGIVIKNFEETDIPKGDVVLVNFWATWCEPCKIEIPELIELQQKYGSHGFTVLGVAMDDEGSSVVAPFVQSKNWDIGGGKQSRMNYPIVIGSEKVADKFGGLLGYPTSVLIGKDGKEIHRTTGAIAYEEYAKLIEGHL
jgi:thiol-disulfide isomerase/thioredoxin